MEEFYREIIIDHYKNPRFKGVLEEKKFSFEDDNPLCGDFLHIDIQTDETNVITDARFSGNGCAISIASADLLIEALIGRSIEDVKKMNKQDILDMLGIELSPLRLKCALLSLKVAKAAVFGLLESDDTMVE